MKDRGIYKSLFAVIFFTLFLPFFAFAQNPSVTSFSVSSTSINSGSLLTLSWTASNAGGYSFVIPCVTGIKIRKEDGSPLVCDSAISSTLTTADSIILFIDNMSGGTRNVTMRLTPKDAGGVDYASAAQEKIVSVVTHPQPITSFTTDTLTTSSGKPVTISWNSQIINTTNLQIDCRNEIRVSSVSYGEGFLPCEKIVFPNDLGAAGSLTFLFSNSSVYPLSYTIKLIPAVVSNSSYDGTHAATLTFTVASDILPDPVMSYVTASSTVLDSGASMVLSWGAQHAVGVNLKMSCNSVLTATSTENPDMLLPCDTYMFSDARVPIGEFTMVFQNKSITNQMVTLSVIPSKQTGVYDATRGKSLSLSIRPVGAGAPSVTPSPSPSPLSSSLLLPPLLPMASSLPVASVSPSIQPKTVFTLFLKRGSRGDQVSALQQFLKGDPVLYPEGLVTGFFGPATERAVQRFQKKYGLVSSGTPSTTGYGVVGPKTRSKLNALP